MPEAVNDQRTPARRARAMMPEREVILSHARALAPHLRARAEQCVSERRVPDETIAEWKHSRLLRLVQPARRRGYELGWDAPLCQVIQALAEAYGSEGWVYRVLADYPQLIDKFPAEAQEEVW